jgi:hypothetical protein
VLMQRGDEIGGDEALLLSRPYHQPVEDILLDRGYDVVDRTHLLAIRGVDRNALVKHLEGDRKALVHPAHTTVRHEQVVSRASTQA